MHGLPLFSFLSSSGGCQSLRTDPLDREDHHRLIEIATGSVVWPSAQNWICRQRKWCRSAHYTAGRQSIPAEPATHSNRGQGKAWQHNSKHVCTNHVSYHCNDSKGHVPRFSDHHHAFLCMMAQRTKYATLVSNAMQTNQTKLPIPITQVKGQGMHARCNAT